MNLRQLEIFSAVAEQRSFSRAARQLHIAQPAVSIAIRKLEQALGLRLFNRADRAVALTPEGEVLYQHALRIARLVEDARREVSELQGLGRGTVRVGIPAMLSSYYFPDVFQAFRLQYPGLSIQVVDAGTRHIQRLLVDDEVDIGVISSEYPARELDSHVVINEEMKACVAPQHPLAGRRTIRFRDLASARLVVHRHGYYLREVVDRFMGQTDSPPRVEMETNLVPLMKRLVLTEQCVGFCLQSVLDQEPGLVGISFRPRVHLQFAIAWKKARHLSLANRAFADFLIDGKRTPAPAT